MGLVRNARRALALSCLVFSVGTSAIAAQHAARHADCAGESASADARATAQWVVDTRDNGGMPFTIVDKNGARAYVFDSHARLLGATVVLLGRARGDESAPGVGLLSPARIPVAERTTPAGRFVSEPGRNLTGEDVVWFDYDAGLAIHRLRPNASERARARRMASDSPDDNRVSAGCVVVPVAFYENVIAPTLGRHRGVVYVLPETRSVQQMFAAGQAL
jgi:hypothetical protein